MGERLRCFKDSIIRPLLYWNLSDMPGFEIAFTEMPDLPRKGGNTLTEIDSNIGPDKGKQTGPKKKWKQHDPKIKLEAVMLLYRDNKDPHIAVDILEGKGIRITISTLHRWRRQFLANAHRAFESSASTIPKGLDNNITYAQSDAKQTGEQGKDNILRGVSP